MTVFIGPQSTGKSLATQMLSLRRGLENLFLLDAVAIRHDKSEIVLSSLEAWLGSPFYLSTSSQAILRWVAGGRIEVFGMRILLRMIKETQQGQRMLRVEQEQRGFALR